MSNITYGRDEIISLFSSWSTIMESWDDNKSHDIATDSPSRICIVKDALKSSGHIREETVAVRTDPKMPPAKPTKLLLGLTFT